MRERKKAGYWEGAPEVCPPKGDDSRRDTPNPVTNVRGDPMHPILMLRSVAGVLWRAVRRSPGPSPAAGPRYLTIGAIVMNTHISGSPAPAGDSSTRRALVTSAILILASDILTARFALVRAMDGLDARELEALYDEVAETVESHLPRLMPPNVTQRDELL